MTTRFTEDHEYIRLDGKTGIVGITNYAQDQLGDIVFVELPNAKIELLEPLGDHSPVAEFLKRNPAGGMHHLCYEVDDIVAARGF